MLGEEMVRDDEDGGEDGWNEASVDNKGGGEYGRVCGSQSMLLIIRPPLGFDLRLNNSHPGCSRFPDFLRSISRPIGLGVCVVWPCLSKSSLLPLRSSLSSSSPATPFGSTLLPPVSSPSTPLSSLFHTHHQTSLFPPSEQLVQCVF